MMQVYLTFDYELFHGKRLGSIKNCMIAPTNLIFDTLSKYDVKATFFVDSAFILKSKELGVNADGIQKIEEQIIKLNECGHSVQLHVHSHWINSDLCKVENFSFDSQTYKIQNFSADEIEYHMQENIDYLTSLCGKPPTIFRAGGWCVQPFQPIKTILKKNKILTDSSVFVGGSNRSEIKGFDFSLAPRLTEWMFSDDPCCLDPKGEFREIPISSFRIPRLFYWQQFFKRLLRNSEESFGDGLAISPSKLQILRLLFLRSTSCVSLDGQKYVFLDKNFEDLRNQYGEEAKMVIIGHPKAMTNNGLKAMEAFIERYSDCNQFRVLT